MLIRIYEEKDYTSLEQVEVSNHQLSFASNFKKCLDENHKNPAFTNLYTIIFGESYIGYILIRYNQEFNNVFIWQFVIDKAFQNKGIGSSVMKILINTIHEEHPNKDILISIKNDNGVMKNLCRKNGFDVLDKNENEIDYILRKN